MAKSDLLKMMNEWEDRIAFAYDDIGENDVEVKEKLVTIEEAISDIIDMLTH